MMDNYENIYMADGDLTNCTIRKISTDGYVTTYAGTGIRGFSGDCGPAPSAKLNHPSDIVFDKHGDMLIADELNNRIRKVDNVGMLTKTRKEFDLGITENSCWELLEYQLK